MTTSRGRTLCALLFALLALTPGSAMAGSAGKANFVKPADSSFDSYTLSPTAAQQTWMRDHYSRMRTYAPYFDSRLSWYPSAWSYEDSYAIYPSQASSLDQYILKDSSGNRLWIQYACSGGSCTQYAADIGDPGWRQRYIDIAKAKAATGYKGIFVDDVNFAFKVSDGNGNFVAPMDKRTGAPMTLDNWQRYFAEFMEQLRAALPADFEIVQNQVYYHGGLSNAYVKRAIEASTHIEIEHGVIDTGLTGGTGTYGYETVLAWAEYAHSRGKGVVWDAENTWGREYQLATNFLVSTGLDGFHHPDSSNPDNWWSGYDTDLGQPLGLRYSWNGVFRRDFENGIVLVNQPGQTTKTLGLGADYKNLAGSTVTSVSLPAREGAVLLRPAPAPADTTSPDTTLTGGPVGTVDVSTADFTFTANEVGASFECSIDSGGWAACPSPKTLSNLADGGHGFDVRAKDAAGNIDPTPASRSWTVATPPPADTTPPDTSLSGGPTGNVTTLTATFGLVSTEAGSSFECRLDAAAWAACTDPMSLLTLSLGSHTFQARARDTAGNVDPSPASRTWTIKRRHGQTATIASTHSSTRVDVRGRAVRKGGPDRGRGSRVQIMLQRRLAGRWVKVAEQSVRAGAGGRFATTFRRMPAARYRVRLGTVGKAGLRLVLESGMPRLVKT